MSYRPYSEIIAAAVRLDNDQFMKGRNQADTLDLNIIKIGLDDSIVLDNSDGSSIVRIDSSVFQLASFATTPSPASLQAGQMYWDSTSDEIKVYDGSSWTSIGSGGGITWSDPVDASIIPNTSATYDLGSSTFRFNDIYAQRALLVDTSGDPDVYIEASGTSRYTQMLVLNTPDDEQGFLSVHNAIYLGTDPGEQAIIVGDNVGDLVITTRSLSSDTGNLYLRSGNASSTYDSGDIFIETGSVVSGTKGDINLNAKNIILQPISGIGSIIIQDENAWIRQYDGTITQELIRYAPGLSTILIGNGQSATFSGQTYFQGAMNILDIQDYNGNSSYNFVIENGPTFSRPLSPVDGMVYYDTDINKVIVYNSGNWYDVLGNTV